MYISNTDIFNFRIHNTIISPYTINNNFFLRFEFLEQF